MKKINYSSPVTLLKVKKEINSQKGLKRQSLKNSSPTTKSVSLSKTIDFSQLSLSKCLDYHPESHHYDKKVRNKWMNQWLLTYEKNNNQQSMKKPFENDKVKNQRPATAQGYYRKSKISKTK